MTWRLAVCLALLMPAAVAAEERRNPFGVMVSTEPRVPDNVLAATRELGVAYLRPPDVALDAWIASGGSCEACETVKQSGLRPVLVVRPGDTPGSPERTRATLKQVLEAYQPALVVADGDASWLRIACQIARRAQIPCANAGLSSEIAATLVWAEHLERRDADAACEFAMRTMYTSMDPRAGRRYCRVRSLRELPGELRARIEQGRRLLERYRAAPIDYVNLQWYIHDAPALVETAAFLRVATGKPVMSSEIGQWEWDAQERFVAPLLQAALDAGLGYAIWFSVDNEQALGLINGDGTLRPSGKAFRAFVTSRR